MTAARGDPEIAVVIPHYNDTARLARCLDALMPQAGESTEVVVVDNGSTEDVAAVVSRHPGARLIREPRKGAGPARNSGVAGTTAPRLFFIDADCVPAPDWIAAGRAALEGREIVGGAVGTFDETPGPRSGAEAFEAVFAFNFKRYIEVEGFTGAGNMLAWRRVFEAVGGFRDTVSEDVEWSRRATAAGFRIAYVPGVRVLHPTRADWPALRRKWLRITEESFALRAGQPWPRLGWAARAVLVLGSPARDLPRIAVSDRLAGWGERRRAMATLLAIRSQRAVWMLRQAIGLKIR